MSTRLMNRWECVLRQMGRQSVFPEYLGETTKCGASEPRVLTPSRRILAVKEIGGVYYGLGLLYPGTIPLQAEGVVARKSSSLLSHFGGNVVNQYTVITNTISMTSMSFKSLTPPWWPHQFPWQRECAGLGQCPVFWGTTLSDIAEVVRENGLIAHLS